MRLSYPPQRPLCSRKAVCIRVERSVLHRGKHGALDAQAQSVYDRFGIECYFDISEVSLEETTATQKRVASRGGSDPGMIMVVTADHVITWVSQTIAPEFTDEDMEALHNAYDKPETYYDAVAAVFSEFEEYYGARLCRPAARPLPKQGDPEDRQRPLLVDDAGILSNTERTEVEARLNELSRSKLRHRRCNGGSHDYYGVTDYTDDFTTTTVTAKVMTTAE